MPSIGDIFNFLSGQIFGRPLLPDADLSGQTIIITGANTGLGFEAAKHIARKGASTLILGCRSVEKGETARKAIQSLRDLPSEITIAVWTVDLAQYSSVQAFCARAKSLTQLHGIILNAGVELDQFSISEGLETTLTVNVISTFMMATGLIDKLWSTAREQQRDTKMVIVGSLIHNVADGAQLDVEGDILEALSREKHAQMKARYSLSKLIAHLCFIEMVEATSHSESEAPKLVVNLVNPGWCRTELSRNRPISPPERFMKWLIGWTGEEGSRTLVDALVASRESDGQYLSECKVKGQSSFVRSAKGRATARKLWEEVSDRIEEGQKVSRVKSQD